MMLDHLFVALWVLAGWKKICKKGYERPVLTSPLSTSTKACRSSKHISMHMLRHTHTHTQCSGFSWKGEIKYICRGCCFFFVKALFLFSWEKSTIYLQFIVLWCAFCLPLVTAELLDGYSWSYWFVLNPPISCVAFRFISDSVKMKTHVCNFFWM